MGFNWGFKGLIAKNLDLNYYYLLIQLYTVCFINFMLLA